MAKSQVILLICGSNSWGGLEIMAMNSAIQLKKLGCKVLLSAPPESELLNRSAQNNIETTYIEGGKLKKIKNLANLIKKNNIKIVHTHLSHDLWILVPALKISGTGSKLFMTKHIASGVKKKDIFHKLIYNRVNKIFAVSEFIMHNVLATCPVPKDKTVVLHNGIDIEKYDKRNYSKQDMREELGIERDKIVIGLIGRITPGKGHFEFIKAAEIVNREYFGKIFFLIAGGTARGEEYIEKELKKLAGEKKITNLIFTGYKENIPEILAGTDILAFPSHDESFGLALLEAMAMEVPIVTSSNSGIKDIIPSDEFAILVKPKDHEALAEGIIKLIIEPELRKKLVQNSRRRAEENFNLETITKELIKHYGI